MSTFKDIFWNTSAILVLLVQSLYLLGCIGKCPKKTITTDFSQSNTRKFRHNAGKQCVAMLWCDHRQPMAGTRSVVFICIIQHTLLLIIITNNNHCVCEFFLCYIQLIHFKS